MKKNSSVKLIIVILTSLFLVFVNYNYLNKVFSPHFVDEDDNIVLGSYLLKNEKLYKDLFSHHQPLAYILSAGIQRVTNPNSVYLLIKKHREAVVVWSVIWSVVLLSSLQLPIILFVLIFELIKIFYFGNLFLSESIGVYPFVYLTWQVMFGKNISKLKIAFLSFCFSIVALTLSAVWLVLAFEFILLIRKTKYKRLILYFILGALPATLISLYYSPLTDYLNYAYFMNFQYYIPITSGPLVASLPKAFLAPLLSLFTFTNSESTVTLQTLSAIFLVTCILIIKSHLFKIFATEFLILGLSNLRFGQVGLQYYSGFHNLPWIGLLILFVSYNLYLVYTRYSNKWVKICVLLLTLLIVFVTFTNSLPVLLQKHNINTDYYVNYSRQIDFGDIIKIMKSDKDTLMVVPDEWLIYWQASIDHRSRMVNYYAWMSEVPELKDIVEKSFQDNPPTFFYCDCLGSYFGLENYFYLYQPIVKDGTVTKLLVLKSKIKTLTVEQKTKLKFYNVATL